MLPAYPEARRVFNYEELDLKPFYRGAEVVTATQRRRLADPFAHPLDALKSLTHDLLTWRDLWLTLVLRKDCWSVRRVERGGEARETETEDYLRDFGFSDSFIDRFFRPFFGGVFLEKDLRTSSLMFRFLYAMFARSGVALPAAGMQALPDQLVAALPAEWVRCGQAVRTVAPGAVALADGEVLRAPRVVLAVDQSAAAELLPEALRTPGKRRWRSTCCLYFAAHRRPVREGILFLDGEGRGPVNNACVISNVAPGYAPPGQHLISATVVGSPVGEDLEAEVRLQLTRWFGLEVGDWRLLRTYRIAQALPEEVQLRLAAGATDPRLADGLYAAGDYCEDASINGALLSGRKAAEAVLEDRAK